MSFENLRRVGALCPVLFNLYRLSREGSTANYSAERGKPNEPTLLEANEANDIPTGIRRDNRDSTVRERINSTTSRHQTDILSVSNEIPCFQQICAICGGKTVEFSIGEEILHCSRLSSCNFGMAFARCTKPRQNGPA